MISKEQLHEFGFEAMDKFPRLLTNHEVTVSLPTAIAHGVSAVNVTIDHGVAIPVQMPSVPNGMIIRHDGTMVYVAHRIPEDPSSELRATFTDDISYDIRLESYAIMRRAVELDKELKNVWDEIIGHWLLWYPPFIKEIQRQVSGRYPSAAAAIRVLELLIVKFIEDVKRQTPQAAQVPLKITVQTMDELRKGWQGEEMVVDQQSVGGIMLFGLDAYLKTALKEKFRKTLKNPVFSSLAAFEVVYEPRIVPVIKLVVDNPPAADNPSMATGIDLI